MLVSGLASMLVMGFTLGVKHATEPDHMIAVSTIASRTRRLALSSMIGVFWGLGHTATLLLIGMLVIALNQHIPERTAAGLELFVGVMLVYLGISGLYTKKKADRTQGHFLYARSFVIGIIHGLAGSAAMVLLTMATAQTSGEAFQFILVFGAGTILGMLLVTTLLGLPFLLKSKGTVPAVVARAASVLSALYGVYYMYEVVGGM